MTFPIPTLTALLALLGTGVVLSSGCRTARSSAQHSAASGIDYVLVPEGAFLMGCVPNDRDCDSFERPQHQVTITRAFRLASTETTVAQFRRFVQATGFQTAAERERRGRMADTAAPDWEWREGLYWQQPLHKGVDADSTWPAVQVDPNDALAFCSWDGGRLPTEAEWEHAARGKLNNARYPWNGESLTHADGTPRANGADAQLHWTMPMWATARDYDDGFPALAPVASFAPNDLGLFDMSGNVYEWTADAFDSLAYAAPRPRVDPLVRNESATRVARGGTWGYPPEHLRISFRAYFSASGFWTATLGFRCARDKKAAGRVRDGGG